MSEANVEVVHEHFENTNARRFRRMPTSTATTSNVVAPSSMPFNTRRVTNDHRYVEARFRR
jgi:hypothetical protein